MTLYDAARKLDDRYNRTQSGKYWQSYLLAAKLRDLRSREHLTQAETEKRAGISESTLRDYELQKSSPKRSHLEALSKAFDVRPEALRLYDIDMFPANALFELSETYGLTPCAGARDERFAILEPRNGYMASALAEWAERYDALKRDEISRDDYERWKDRFHKDFNPADFPLRYNRTDDGFAAIEPWQNIQFANTLQRLRKGKGLTQEELGLVSGCAKTAIRAYEQRKRLPKSVQIKALALALDVTEGALIFFDFGNPVQAVHALFQVANQHGLIPQIADGVPVLRTIQPDLERCIDQWAWALEGRYDDADLNGKPPKSYQQWKDRYDPISHWGSAQVSRYRISIGGAVTVVDSPYDPFDERYADQGGFLRA